MSLKAINWMAKQTTGDDKMKSALFWLAFHLNDETGKCCPSISTLQAEMEVKSDNTVRGALRRLREAGFISWERETKDGLTVKTNYHLHMNGSMAEGTSVSNGTSTIAVPQPLREGTSTVEGGTSTVAGGVLQPVRTNREIEQGIEQGRVAHASRSLPRATHTREDVVEKKFDCEHADEEDDDKQSAQPVIPEEPPFDAGLFDEAQLVASGNLESFENEVNAEVVFSPDAQIPIENIEILNATASDSIFGTDTPPKDQNAAERKSEAISKPKRKRVSSSVVKDKPEDISQEVWDDWLTTRRAKRLPLTQTALNSVRREAASAGLTFQAAVTFAVEQGWAAFRAEWYRNATRKGDSTKTNARYLTAQERYEERMRKAGEMSDEEYFAQFDLPEEILNYEKAQEAKRHVAS